MSGLESDFMEQFAEDGTFDFVKAEIARVNATTSPEASAEDTDSTPSETDEQAAVEPVTTEPEGDEVVVEPEGDEPAAPPADGDEEEMFLELTPELEALINEKYDGDINKALNALPNAQSVIGRQGNELGDVKRQLAEIQEKLNRPVPQAYDAWPDSDDEPEEIVPVYRNIAEQAFDNEDPQTFIRAVETWREVDPLGAATYRDAKRVELLLREREDQTAPAQDDLEPRMAALVEKYPDIQKPEIQQEIGALAQARPTLGRLLADATTAERVQILEDLYVEVAGRKASDTSQHALRKVAIRRSEEATQARQAAQVARGGGGAPTPTEPEDVRIPLGKTKQSMSANKLGAELEAIFGHKVDIGE